MTRSMYERQKAFAKELSERLTAEEIAMIFYSCECEVCAEGKNNGTECSFECAEGICRKAIKDFSEHYDFTEHKEVERGEWIPISERLPENDDDVLATDGVDIFVAWYHQMSWSSSDAHYDEHTPVIAWQPLPKHYEEGDKADE